MNQNDIKKNFENQKEQYKSFFINSYKNLLKLKLKFKNLEIKFLINQIEGVVLYHKFKSKII